MAVADYTEYDEVRAVLGVSSDELPDEAMSGSTAWFALKLDLSDVGATILSDYATALAITSPNQVEQSFTELLKVFSTYSVANQLLDSLPMFSPKAKLDGDTSVTRFSSSPYKETVVSVRSSYLRFRKRLVRAYELYLSGASAVSDSQLSVMPLFGGSASPDYDPVTGA